MGEFKVKDKFIIEIERDCSYNRALTEDELIDGLDSNIAEIMLYTEEIMPIIRDGLDDYYSPLSIKIKGEIISHD